MDRRSYMLHEIRAASREKEDDVKWIDSKTTRLQMAGRPAPYICMRMRICVWYLRVVQLHGSSQARTGPTPIAGQAGSGVGEYL